MCADYYTFEKRAPLSFEVNRMTLSPKKLISSDSLGKKSCIILLDGKALLFFSLARFSNSKVLGLLKKCLGILNFNHCPVYCCMFIHGFNFFKNRIFSFFFFYFLPHIGKRDKVSFGEKAV